MMKELLPEILMFASFVAYQTNIIDGIILISIGVVIFMNFFKRLNTLSLIFIFLSFAANYNSLMTCGVLIVIAVSLNTYEEPDESFYNYYNSQNERASRHFRNCKEGQTVLSYHYETEDGQVIFAYYRRENGNMKKRIGTEKKEDFSAHTWDYGKI